MILKLVARSVACVSLLFAAAIQAAPQIESPGFYFETIGDSVADVAAAENQYVEGPNGSYFIGLYKVAAVAFAQKADVVFAVEKAGLIRVIVDGETQALPVVDMRDQVSDWIDSGMGGVAVHPDFPAVKEILITYTHWAGVTPVADEQPKYARVARINLREEIGADGKVSYFGDPPTEDDVIIGRLKATPEFPSCNDRPLGADCGAVDEAAHSFTFVHYGPDGKIYVGTGDGAGYFKPEPNALYAQINQHLSGKILRVNPDGSGPEDNPFFTGNKWDNESKVFAKGFRNPKSGSFDPATGKLCVGNVGWFSKEGIYCVDPGDNAGWPCIENGPAPNGYQSISLFRDGEKLANCPLDPSTYIQPDYTYSHIDVQFPNGEVLPVGAVIGCARPTAAEYPDTFKGTCVFGDYVFDTLESVRFGPGTTGNPSSTLLLSGAGNPTDLVTDRNGRLCYAAYDTGVVDGLPVSEIRCLGYDNDGSIPLQPVPSFTSVADAANPAFITMNASPSFHPAGDELVYSWDFGDGNTAGNVETVEHTYETFGKYKVTLTATTAGTEISRSTFQLVEVPDPDFVTPIQPSVQDITFSDNDHEISSPVEFDVLVRNDLGTDSFRILANIYNTDNVEVAHLVLDDIFQLDAGQTMTIPFRWDQAEGLGDYRIGIEFYSEDFVSWNLKYSDSGRFFVRNRAAPTGGETAGTAGDNTAGTTGDTTAGTEAGDTEGTGGTATDGITTDGTTANTAGDVGGEADVGAEADGGDSGGDDGLFGCSVSTTGNDPTLGLLMLGALLVLVGRGAQTHRRRTLRAVAISA